MTDFLQKQDGELSFEQQIENSLTHLDDSISLLVTFVDTFPPEYTEQVLFGEWSLKDMLAF